MVTVSDSRVTLTANNQIVSDWISVSVSCGIERSTNSFDFRLSERYAQPGVVQFNAGNPCTVQIGSTQVIKGFIDRYTINIAAEGRHEIQVSGRGVCRDLTDCSAVLENNVQQVNASSAVDLAKLLTKAFKIPVVYKGGGDLKEIPYFTINLGETPYEIIERVCRYSALLAYEDFQGNLVLSGVGTISMATGLSEDNVGLVEGATANNSADMRFSDYTVYYESVDSLKAAGAPDGPSANLRGHALDKGVLSYRPKIIISQQGSNIQDYAQKLAEWYAARNRGRSQQLQVTVPTWRDAAGKLWTPNTLCRIEMPTLKITGQQWIISEVEFTTSGEEGSGTKAHLTLMPSEAFVPEPVILQTFAAPSQTTTTAGQEKAN